MSTRCQYEKITLKGAGLRRPGVDISHQFRAIALGTIYVLSSCTPAPPTPVPSYHTPHHRTPLPRHPQPRSSRPPTFRLPPAAGSRGAVGPDSACFTGHLSVHCSDPAPPVATSDPPRPSQRLGTIAAPVPLGYRNACVSGPSTGRWLRLVRQMPPQ